jgi:hypothetical protein
MMEGDVTFANLGNLITVKVNSGDFVTLFILDTSIIKGPILTVQDCFVHQSFDLTHGGNPFGTNVVWHEKRGDGTPLVPDLRVSHCCQFGGRNQHLLSNPAAVGLTNRTARILQVVYNHVLTFGEERINFLRIALEGDAYFLTVNTNGSDARRLGESEVKVGHNKESQKE